MRNIDSETLKLMRNVVDFTPESASIQKTYEIEVVTPMFGGGVRVGENDKNKLIRETSIRGSLRFWYRATVGAKFQTPEEMFQEESEIFGTTDAPSKLGVRVSDVSNEVSKSYNGLCPDSVSPLGYVLFPFAPNKRNGTLEKSGCCLSFKLNLSYPKDYEKRINTALWAWFNFGGIGARTRRGCGALFCEEFAPRIKENAVVWKQDFVSTTLNGAEDVVRNWSTLGKVFLHPKKLNPMDAWKDGIADYKHFRQDGESARAKGQSVSRPGRSYWSEADALRKITMRHSPLHKPYDDRPIAFPRAELGAPIVFQFKDCRDNDPERTTIYPTGCERASSPVIIKPLVFEDGKIAAPCVVFLNGSRVKTVMFENKEYPVVDKKNATYKNSPLRNYSPEGSAFEGFKNFVKDKRGYKAIQ